MLQLYCKVNILKVGLYGFMTGMSLLLSGNVINFWLASLGIDTKIIGLFSCIALPYAFKYFIASFIDKHNLNHKSCLVICQLMLVVFLVSISFINPIDNLLLTALIGIAIAFSAVIQDIILNSNRIKIIKTEEQGPASAMYNIGYRLGMLFSGAGTIMASVYISWNNIYLILAAIYLLLTILVCYFYYDAKDVKLEEIAPDEARGFWYNMFIKPFKHFISMNNMIWVLLFIIIYRLSDNMLSVMINPFLLQTGYDAAEIASISKFFGTIMVILGGILSGPIIMKIGLRRSLIFFSAIHMLGHFLFIILGIIGKNIAFLYFLTGYEAVTGGMVMTIYIAFISSLCKGKYITSQYALLSSGIGLSRVLFPVSSGIIVDYLGWISFFVIIAIISALTVIFVWFSPKQIYQLSKD